MKERTPITEICSRIRSFVTGGNREHFNGLALELFRFQFDQNAPYQSFCERTGRAPDLVREWRDIPAMVTSAFKDRELTVLPREDRTAVFHSSGTTEQRPSRHFHNAETLKVYEESLLAWFKPHLLPDCEKAEFILLSPPTGQAPHSSLAHMFETVSRTYEKRPSQFVATVSNDNSWVIDFSKLAAALSSLSGAVVLCGTAFSFVHWCDHLAEKEIQVALPPGSRVFETGGYKGRSRSIPKAELHQLIEEKLGIPQTHIVSEYGMSELSSQAYDRTLGGSAARVFHFPPWTRAIIVSPETRREVAEGEPGLVRIYDLANVGSVMAIQTEDLAIRRGDGFELIGRAAFTEPRGCSLLPANS